MRLIRHFAVSVGLGTLLVSSAVLGSGALLTTGGLAEAAVSNPPGGGATGSVDPSSATPGSSVTFQVFCASLNTASATLFGTTLGLPEQIPMDKESVAGTFSATVTLPNSIRPGAYNPDMDCSDGSSATTTLTVTALPRPGGAQTGDGTTSTETNHGVAAGGMALAGFGALTGGVAMLRRRRARRG
jgi:hypothetical protein